MESIIQIMKIPLQGQEIYHIPIVSYVTFQKDVFPHVDFAYVLFTDHMKTTFPSRGCLLASPTHYGK